jgi:hypothetical protein
MPERFRKRPVEVEAIQWTGDNLAELRAFTGDCFLTSHAVAEITAEVYDILHSTWVGVKTGQWVIRGIRGEFYPIDETVLADTYERVSVQ